MITISLCMIVKNEEESLAKCLSSVKGIAEEIIIVDTGSTDRTKEIARQFTDRIFDFEWIDDFSAARNYAFSKATKKYILWLDADDIIKEKDRLLFIQLKKKLSLDVDSVTMHYYLAVDEAGNVTCSLKRNRLVRRDRNFQWIGAVHEFLAVDGNIQSSEIGITHCKNKAYTDRNLQIYLKREREGKPFTPRDLYYFANELRDHAHYRKAILYYEQFLDGKQGWIEDNIQACLKMGDCYAKLEDKEKFIESICLTLIYDKPRAEFCCTMGNYFLENQQYQSAIYWFTTATDYKPDSNHMGMDNPNYYTWLPHLQLCFCYDRLGQHEKANEHNERALSYHSQHPSMLYNTEYFRKLFAERTKELEN
ncbi:glycosyltransferase [Paenibacillus thiaminolyticus]|uniref:glycosyltransferase family 2 protein n=1 Tax=Paenibacillus thiaminolyticus TaxID=49283 RepID=UPI00116424D7|nr:glycosyltransferase family 2 protein [Paenibacillus thiaminolyticus]NGP59447.1 glycosyltransferase [Paenibacillus thiaminolyticus]